jgi:hypothetical protein
MPEPDKPTSRPYELHHHLSTDTAIAHPDGHPARRLPSARLSFIRFQQVHDEPSH